MSFVFDQPAGCKRSRQNKKSGLLLANVTATNTVHLNFLDFLQIQRNNLLRQTQTRMRVQEKIAELTNQGNQAQDLRERNKIKKHRIQLQHELHSCGVMTLEDFDHKIIPLLELYYKDRDKTDNNKLIELFKNEFLLSETLPIMHTLDDDVCKTCNQEFLQSSEESIMICRNCGYSKPFMDASVSTIAYGDEIEYTSFSYKRINHLNEWLNHFQAKEATPVPLAVIQKIMTHLYEQRITKSNQITFTQVKKAQKDLGLRKYYDQTMQIWCRITGSKPVRLDPICEEKIRLMFITIQAPFDKYCPETRKNFLSYPYCIYKFCQMLGQEGLLPYFSLLKGKEKLKLQEDIFNRICNDVGWKFIPIQCD